MSFNPNIPQSTDIPSQSQGEILTNFQQLNTVFDIDHVPFNDATVADRGKHDQSTYIELAVDPTTAVDEVAVYSKDQGGVAELFYRRESNGAVGQLTIFKAWASFTGSPVAIQDSFNISGIVRNAAGNWTVSFTNNLPNANYAVLVTPQMTSAFSTGGIPGVNNRQVGSFDLFVRALTGNVGTDLDPISFLVIQN